MTRVQFKGWYDQRRQKEWVQNIDGTRGMGASITQKSTRQRTKQKLPPQC